jgi:hypothetical protein
MLFRTSVAQEVINFIHSIGRYSNTLGIQCFRRSINARKNKIPDTDVVEIFITDWLVRPKLRIEPEIPIGHRFLEFDYGSVYTHAKLSPSR